VRTNRCARIVGKEESIRFVNLAIYQNFRMSHGNTTVDMAASENPLLSEGEIHDPIIFATGFKRNRFYMFNKSENKDDSRTDRDIYNENPKTTTTAPNETKPKVSVTSSTATIHTTVGDIKFRLFPEAAPNAVENFVTHARNKYYDGTIFHRVIRKFMIQGGDPLGDGTGGESIWGKHFKDEITDLKHDKPYTLSMANAGPNTNGSQFFITTEKAPWLDGKHTIFGRAVEGLEVVHNIERTRTNKHDRPLEPISIVNIDV
jgi:peptidylprolyl isomerase domain and WD repeat-containing protein 1